MSQASGSTPQYQPIARKSCSLIRFIMHIRDQLPPELYEKVLEFKDWERRGGRYDDPLEINDAEYKLYAPAIEELLECKVNFFSSGEDRPGRLYRVCRGEDIAIARVLTESPPFSDEPMDVVKLPLMETLPLDMHAQVMAFISDTMLKMLERMIPYYSVTDRNQCNGKIIQFLQGPTIHVPPSTNDPVKRKWVPDAAIMVNNHPVVVFEVGVIQSEKDLFQRAADWFRVPQVNLVITMHVREGVWSITSRIPPPDHQRMDLGELADRKEKDEWFGRTWNIDGYDQLLVGNVGLWGKVLWRDTEQAKPGEFGPVLLRGQSLEKFNACLGSRFADIQTCRGLGRDFYFSLEDRLINKCIETAVDMTAHARYTAWVEGSRA